MAREYDTAARRAEPFEQAQRVRYRRLRDARQVVARDLRIVHREHRPKAGVDVAAVVLHVDEDEGGARPVDLEPRPGRVPTGERLRRVDGQEDAHPDG